MVPAAVASVLWCWRSSHPRPSEVWQGAPHRACIGCTLYGKADEAWTCHDHHRRSPVDCRMVPPASSPLPGWKTLLSDGAGGRSDLFYSNWQGIKGLGEASESLDLEPGFGF